MAFLFQSNFKTGRLRTLLVKGAVASFAIQVLFAGLAFLNAVILAHLLGAEGYGAFANAMAWVSLLVIPSTFGFGALLVRDVAILRSRREWAALKGLLDFAKRFVVVLSLLLTLVFLVVVGFVFSSPEQEVMRLSLWVAAPLVPLFASLNVRESVARGLEHINRARLPGMVFRPGILLLGIGSINILWPGYISAPVAMSVNVCAAIVSLVVAIFWLEKILPFEIDLVRPEYRSRVWLRAAFPMLVYGGMQVILGQTDIVMLGVMCSGEDVGLYAAASRLGYLLVYVTFAADTILAPVVARLYASGEEERLQRILLYSVRISFLIVLPFGLLFIFFGENILVLFGHDFVAAKTALIVLAVGRLLDVALGSAALVLAMTGNERIIAVSFMGVGLINIILNGVLIPRYGVEGAAFASILSLFAAKLFLGNYIRTKVGIRVTVLGI